MSNRNFVLDASAILCALLAEPGFEVVRDTLPDACASAVNVAEVIAKLAERGVPLADITLSLAELDLEVIPFTIDHAQRSGALREATRRFGLSLGDCACLALAQAENAIAITADRVWANLDVGIEIRLVR